MDGLNIDNILSVDEIDNLFVEEEETESPDVDLGEEEKQKRKRLLRLILKTCLAMNQRA